jgi:hypothetical protein
MRKNMGTLPAQICQSYANACKVNLSTVEIAAADGIADISAVAAANVCLCSAVQSMLPDD